MKQLSIALALLLLTFVFAFGQTEQSKSQEKNVPTFDETVKWIAQKLPEMAAYEGKTEKGITVTLRVVSASFDGHSCALSEQHELVSSGRFRMWTTDSATYAFSLASLDPEQILVEQSKDDYEPARYDLTLNVRGGKKAIKRTNISRSSYLPTRSYESMMSRIVLSFDNEETARRFEKAFKHAARLSQSLSKEPF